MNVKELINELEKYPDNMDVFIDERATDFTYGLLNSVKVKKVNFKEDPNGQTLATNDCIILSEL